MRTLLLLALLCAPAQAGPISVYFLAGQSNASGFASAEGLPSSLANQADVLYRPTTGLLTTLQPVAGKMGPEITLGRSLADASTEPIAIVKYAIGSTSMVDWNPTTGIKYKNLMTRIDSTLGVLTKQGYTPTIRGGFWMQGEEDALSDTLARNYGAALDELLSALRGRFGAELPIAIGRINAPFRPYRAEVREAQDAAADVITQVWNTDDLPLMDKVHYSQVGQLKLGRRFAASAIGWRYQSQRRFGVAAVPEPSTMGLLLACLALPAMLTTYFKQETRRMCKTETAAMELCHDCNAKPGELHADGCDVERCAECGRQRISCGHRSRRPRLPWTGMWPGDAEAVEFGWYCYWDEAKGWVRCDKDHPQAGPDLNRLHSGEAKWDASLGRFVKR